MSLPQDPQGWWEEVQTAERATAARLSSWDELVGKYVGPFYERSSDNSSEHYDPENHAYEMVRFYMPQLAWSNPRVRVKSRLYGADRAALKIQHVVNQWVQDHYYGEFLLGPVADSLFGYGVTLTERVESDWLELGEGKPAMTVKKSRISPRRYFSDPLVVDRDEERFRGHFWVMDKDAAIEMAEEGQDEGWDPEIVRNLVTGVDTDRLHRPKQWRDRVDREEIVFCDIWDREDQRGKKEDGYNGSLVTLAVGQGDGGESYAEFPRETQAAFCPPWGPYTLYDIYPVPDRTGRLAPLVATTAQVRDWNRHARGVSDSAARYKRLILVDSENPDLVEQVRDEQHDEVIPVAGLEKDSVIGQEVGGISEQNLVYLQVAKERVERVSGMSEAQRGQVQGQATATEAAIAAAAGDLGTEFVKLQIQRAVRRDLLAIAWYLNHDDEFAQVLGPDAAEKVLPLDEEGQPLVEEKDDDGETVVDANGDPVMRPLEDGEMALVTGGDPEIPLEELALELEPMSMERTTNAQNQRRVMEAFQFSIQAAQAKLMIPGFDADSLAQAAGEAMNFPSLGEVIAGVPSAETPEAQAAVQAMPSLEQALGGSVAAGGNAPGGGKSNGTYKPAMDLVGRQTGRQASQDIGRS